MEKNEAISQMNDIFRYVKLSMNNVYFDGEEFVNKIEKAMELHMGSILMWRINDSK